MWRGRNTFSAGRCVPQAPNCSFARGSGEQEGVLRPFFGLIQASCLAFAVSTPPCTHRAPHGFCKACLTSSPLLVCDDSSGHSHRLSDHDLEQPVPKSQAPSYVAEDTVVVIPKSPQVGTTLLQQRHTRSSEPIGLTLEAFRILVVGGSDCLVLLRGSSAVSVLFSVVDCCRCCFGFGYRMFSSEPACRRRSHWPRQISSDCWPSAF